MTDTLDHAFQAWFEDRFGDSFIDIGPRSVALMAWRAARTTDHAQPPATAGQAASALDASPVDALRELVDVLTGGRALTETHKGDGAYVGFGRELKTAIYRARIALGTLE